MTPPALRLLVRLLAVSGAPLGLACSASSAPSSPASASVGGLGGQGGAGGAGGDAGDEDETSCATEGPAPHCYAPAAGAACLPAGDTAITDTSPGALLGGCGTSRSEYCDRAVVSGPAPGPGGCCYEASCTCCSSPFGRPMLVGGRPRLSGLARGGAWAVAGPEPEGGGRGENDPRRPLSLRPRGQPR